MKCREFDAILMDLARGCELAEGARQIADGHALNCSRCAARLAREREVRKALDALAESTRDCGAPERVEATLVRAFAQRREHSPARRIAAPLWLALAAAGALLAIVAGSAWLRPGRVTSSPAPRVEAPVESSAPAPAHALPRQAVARPVVRKPAPRKAAARRQAREREVMTQFYPLQYPDREGAFERGPVVRLQVPRSMLAPFGLPIDPDRASEPVQADVVLDDTGMARAIRFVALVRN
jgi:hypothetical protein